MSQINERNVHLYVLHNIKKNCFVHLHIHSFQLGSSSLLST